jgi:hypothetical protein
MNALISINERRACEIFFAPTAAAVKPAGPQIERVNGTAMVFRFHRYPEITGLSH